MQACYCLLYLAKWLYCGQKNMLRREVFNTLAAVGMASVVSTPSKAERNLNGSVMTLQSEQLFTISFKTAAPIDIGSVPVGRRMVAPIIGGSFQGPRLHGEVLPVGGDWLVVRQDGNFVLDVRAILKTHRGEVISMTYGGRWVIPPDIRKEVLGPQTGPLVDPKRFYLRVNPLFETVSPDVAWLNDVVAIGLGRPIVGGIQHEVFAIN
jgi:hypothetical protein